MRRPPASAGPAVRAASATWAATRARASATRPRPGPSSAAGGRGTRRTNGAKLGAAAGPCMTVAPPSPTRARAKERRLQRRRPPGAPGAAGGFTAPAMSAAARLWRPTRDSARTMGSARSKASRVRSRPLRWALSERSRLFQAFSMPAALDAPHSRRGRAGGLGHLAKVMDDAPPLGDEVEVPVEGLPAARGASCWRARTSSKARGSRALSIQASGEG